MSLLAKKTKFLVFVKNSVRCKLIIKDKLIEQVMQVTCIRVNISSHQHLAKDFTLQINKTAAVSGCLLKVVWRNEIK